MKSNPRAETFDQIDARIKAECAREAMDETPRPSRYDELQLAAVLTVCTVCSRSFYITHFNAICISCRT